MKLPIYLDNLATTPLDPRVLEAMLPYFKEDFGNATSRQHIFGWKAEAAVERAREQVAQAMGGNSKEIIFTSGATESNNLALLGVAREHQQQGAHLITAVTEHRAILDPCRHLESQGFRVTYLEVDRFGRVAPEKVREALTSQTILITLMTANNEVGTLHSIQEIGKIAKERGVLFHTDAAQAMGKISFKVEEMGVDLVSISAHKIYGPKGVGALYIRRKAPRVQLAPILFGGGHERGLRSGTLNVPGIVGLGEALEIAEREQVAEGPRLQGLRDRLQKQIMENLEGVGLNGHPSDRLPNQLNLSFAGIRSEVLMREISEVAVSSGSACSSAEASPSHVLKALGLSDSLAQSSIRFGLGRFNTSEEVDYVGGRVVEAVRRLRAPLKVLPFG